MSSSRCSKKSHSRPANCPNSTKAASSTAELSGDWKISAKLSSDKIEKGKPFNIDIEFKGEGDLRRLRRPELQFAGFRRVNQEMTQREPLENQWEGTLTTTLIATGEAATLPAFKIAWFNTKDHKYEVVDLLKEMPVEGSSAASSEAVETLAPQFTASGENVRLPLLLNLPAWLAMLVFLTPLACWGVSAIAASRGDEESRKRRELLKKKKELLKKLNRLQLSAGDARSHRSRDPPLVGRLLSPASRFYSP